MWTFQGVQEPYISSLHSKHGNITTSVLTPFSPSCLPPPPTHTHTHPSHCWPPVREEGFQALFKGLWPNYLKVVPSIAIAFVTYEQVRSEGKSWEARGQG